MSDFIERAKFSCALGGAITTIAGLHKVIPIVHASGGCAAALSNTYNLASGYRGTGYCGGSMIPTTNISENHIVFGGEERLKEQISHTINVMDGDLYIVVTGCQVEIIGDDVHSISRIFQDKNVISANTPGFLGNTYKGYDGVLSAIIKHVIPVDNEKVKNTVNILGIIPGHDVFYRGNIEEIKRLLSLIGVKANTFFDTHDTIEDIKKYGKAALSIVFSQVAGIEPASEFQRKHDIPYIQTDIPIGPSGTTEFLHLVAKKLHLDINEVNKVIERENYIYYSYLERLVDIYSDIDFQRYAYVVADSHYAYSYTKFLANDLGWIPHFISINDIEDKELQYFYTSKFVDIEGTIKPTVAYIRNQGEILEAIKETLPKKEWELYYDDISPSFLLGSVLERTLATKLGANFLSAVFPISNRAILNKSYFGFRGAIALIEDLISEIVSAR